MSLTCDRFKFANRGVFPLLEELTEEQQEALPSKDVVHIERVIERRWNPWKNCWSEKPVEYVWILGDRKPYRWREAYTDKYGDWPARFDRVGKVFGE